MVLAEKLCKQTKKFALPKRKVVVHIHRDLIRLNTSSGGSLNSLLR